MTMASICSNRESDSLYIRIKNNLTVKEKEFKLYNFIYIRKKYVLII